LKKKTSCGNIFPIKKCRGFDPHPMLDGSGIKAMPGSIPAPNSG